MLIIPIPKSASSSLAKSITKQNNGVSDNTDYFRQTYLRDLPPAQAYPRLKKTHSEMVELDKSVVERIAANQTTIQKHHFPPTENNQRLLHNIKKVILLREPDEIVESYQRGDATGVFPVQDMNYLFCWNLNSWKKRSRVNGLLQELHNFKTQWETHEGEKLIIYYHDLVKNPETVIRAVHDYFGLSVPTQLSFAKEKFSRETKSVLTKSFLNRVKLVCRHFLSYIR